MSTKKILIKKVVIIGDSGNAQKDILLQDGRIAIIASEIKPENDWEIVNAEGAFVSAGWFDLRCRLSDPGFEEREDILSGTSAAAAGGFTAIACLPDTHPVLESKSQIDYVISRSKDCLTKVYPLGAASAHLEGKDLSEMYDMQRAGAIAFSNADIPFSDAGYLLRALMYTRSFDGLIMSHPEDSSLSKGGMVNESVSTISTGIKTSPRMAESTAVQTQIEVAAYSDCRLHFSHISTRESVELIREAKQKGIKITCDVALINLVLNDEKIALFDSNYKVKPPLRTELDRTALINAVNDGTIDAIVSDHTPLNSELKQLEFDYASYGISNFQTFYPLYNQYLSKDIPLDVFIEKITSGPRKVLQLPLPEIKEGNLADLTVFHPQLNWQFNAMSNFSKSTNNPFYLQNLQGKVIFTINLKKTYKPHF